MSEWKESGIKRRDERHTAVEVRAPGGSKKNMRKWCRGKVGPDLTGGGNPPPAISGISD